jgi:hypothetical protein
MLSSDDIQQIDQVVTKRVNEAVEPLRSDTTLLKSDTTHLKSDTTLLKEGQANLDKRVANLEKGVSRIQRSQGKILDYLDREQVKIWKRVERIEDHLGLRPSE